MHHSISVLHLDPSSAKSQVEEAAAQAHSEQHLPDFSPMPWYASFQPQSLKIADADGACRKLQEIRSAIPPHLFVRDTKKGLAWLGRDLLMAAACWQLALYIDPASESRVAVHLLSPFGAAAARWTCWLL